MLKMDTEKKGTLVMMVGLPYSGKTTVAKSLGFPIVSPDCIRVALHGERFIGVAEAFVWAIAKNMVRALFLAGHDTVILDATNVTKKRRDEWRSQKWERRFNIVSTTASECKRRAEEKGDQEILPVIERMNTEFEQITPEEDA